MAEEQSTTSKFQIFREVDAPSLAEANCMELLPFTPAQAAGVAAMFGTGSERGEEVKVLVNIPGFSLAHAWFKKDFPLPLHSHNVDCLYYIIAGSLKLGSEWLGPRDGFFIPADVPYTYTPGPEGLEILEFRHAQTFDFKLVAKGAGFWNRATEMMAARQDDWKNAVRPLLNA